MQKSYRPLTRMDNIKHVHVFAHTSVNTFTMITDLHIHSKYARACSKLLDLEHIFFWCQIKGIDLVACGDFTHPAWFKEIENKLEPEGNGFFQLRSEETIAVSRSIGFAPPSPKPVRFLLGTEISSIYSQGGKARRIHLLILFPELAHVKRFNQELIRRGANLHADGRPILGLSAQEIASICLDISDRALLIPAHAWTPWYAIFGSKSGFDSVEECFGEYAQFIYAFETGLSSDPKMNWMLSQNDRYAVVSNSDAHSLDNLGREANVFSFPEMTYDQLVSAIKDKDPQRFLFTIEFYPEEGKYHLDGHRICGFSCMPEETKKLNGRCPKCGRLLTVGVHHRISELADHPFGREPKQKIPYKSIVPLQEMIADMLAVGKKTKKVQQLYQKAITRLGNEFHILLENEMEEIAQVDSLLAEGVRRMRSGEVHIKPGYDGEYGTMKIFDEKEPAQEKQGSLI